MLGGDDEQKGHGDAGGNVREIRCADEASARAEATRRQAHETERGVEWIYVPRADDDQWVVFRYTGEPDKPEPKGPASPLVIDGIRELVIDVTQWIR